MTPSHFASGTVFQRLRAVVAWLGMTERAAAFELGLERNSYRKLIRGEVAPTSDQADRILAMSRRARLGDILPSEWCVAAVPAPVPPKAGSRSKRKPVDLTKPFSLEPGEG